MNIYKYQVLSYDDYMRKQMIKKREFTVKVDNLPKAFGWSFIVHSLYVNNQLLFRNFDPSADILPKHIGDKSELTHLHFCFNINSYTLLENAISILPSSLFQSLTSSNKMSFNRSEEINDMKLGEET